MSAILVPPLLMQLLVENAIKHRILPMVSGLGLVSLNFYTKQSLLHIEIRDNGVGLSQSNQYSRNNHEPYGLENIRKRIERLSIIQNKKITFHSAELKDEEGDHL